MTTGEGESGKVVRFWVGEGLLVVGVGRISGNSTKVVSRLLWRSFIGEISEPWISEMDEVEEMGLCKFLIPWW